ncbi:hydroxyisourate hydrolase [Mycolicibacterium smegmatis]|uniref:5-hydroxyisourate hydrolase n=2 Tax=Mycolicibacterium smegmatis (strain ATCC 700084 / mc(2)155) TaxID=246196 RepID=I7FFU1_MYCS2|nr:hydroxyisourate hydrolase [Mycolicibacterium smegmatis]ABK71129.1 transthyretin [Mycolicibacterium smegmatis MC2 155]AFP37733.1 Transthyretin [Mycolicibacterium smegmatis MC2 155]AIU06537.1 5-hydroxyisourate hydrolase [Mycolicibacterium smegmatis MC2 155]AIU13162.1 5-hydroxyisourate hydrolase [Mycolicibacterium smegmatis]AIU19786.1 5-hydroxyisourate hydrolase [Mycolicibacterium smegmatis]
MTHISTHVLDTVTGRPAEGVPVTFSDAEGTVLAQGTTDSDGRIPDLYTGPASGIHRLRFDTATYFAAQQVSSLYPEVVVALDITGAKYHVPLLLAPFAYSTYRGS